MRTPFHLSCGLLLNRPKSQGIDIRKVASLVPPAHLNDTAKVVEEEMTIRIAKLKEKIDMGTIEESSNGASVSHCQSVVDVDDE